MKILLACEESQVVCKAFRNKGHDAYSCDLLQTSGDHPEWHIVDDVLNIINDGWDMMIAFPPCTHLAVSGAKHFKQKIEDGRQQEGIDFFMQLVNAPIDQIGTENPVGIMSTLYRKPDQIIHPYYFGDEAQKTTCLWLKNLPPLYHNAEPNLFDQEITHVGKGEMKEGNRKDGGTYRMPKWFSDNKSSNIRSKTFQGIADAMANQWNF